jgi:hypothetical protein
MTVHDVLDLQMLTQGSDDFTGALSDSTVSLASVNC